MSADLPGYDAWKTRSPEDDEARNFTQCDCCGKYKLGCRDIVSNGMDTHACPECRYDDAPEPPEAWEFEPWPSDEFDE